MKKTRLIKAIKTIEAAVNLIEKCGGPGGKPGPCPKPKPAEGGESKPSKPSAGGGESKPSKPSAGGKDWPSPKYKNGFDENAFMVGKEWAVYQVENPRTPHSSGDPSGSMAWFKTGPAKFVNTKRSEGLNPENVEFEKDSYSIPEVSSSTKTLLGKKSEEALKSANRAKELYRTPDHPEIKKAEARASAYSALAKGSQITREQYKIIAAEESNLYRGGLENATKKGLSEKRDSLLQQAKESRAIGRTLGIDTHMVFRHMNHGISYGQLREVE